MSEMTATRMARGATYLVVAGVGLWLTSLLWRTSVPHLVTPKLDVDSVFGRGLVRRTASYERFLRTDWVLLVVVQLATLLVVLRRSRRLRLGLGRAGGVVGGSRPRAPRPGAPGPGAGRGRGPGPASPAVCGGGAAGPAGGRGPCGWGVGAWGWGGRRGAV